MFTPVLAEVFAERDKAKTHAAPRDELMVQRGRAGLHRGAHRSCRVPLDGISRRGG